MVPEIGPRDRVTEWRERTVSIVERWTWRVAV